MASPNSVVGSKTATNITSGSPAGSGAKPAAGASPVVRVSLGLGENPYQNEMVAQRLADVEDLIKKILPMLTRT